MAVVLPHGALFRMGAEGRIRRQILEMDLLEAVIGLGPNLFYGTGLAEIAANDWNLNIPRYVEPIIEEETITVAEAVTNLKIALNDAYAGEDRLQSLLRQAGVLEP